MELSHFSLKMMCCALNADASERKKGKEKEMKKGRKKERKGKEREKSQRKNETKYFSKLKPG